MKKIQNNSAGSLREKQKAETYALILNVAGDMFESVGYEKTTMRKVAAKVGISPGAIFKHFENKTSLLAAKLYDDIELIHEKAIKTVPKEETVQKQFLYITECFFKYYEVRPVLSKMLVKHSLFVGGKWAEKIEDQIKRLGEKIVNLISLAKKHKEIREDVDELTLATTLWSNYLFVLILLVNAPDFKASFAVEMLTPLVNQTFSGAVTGKNKKGDKEK
ncbi:MAG: TetR/AcrR family transcriptional regulator [Desulfobacterales bacterium]|nr:TetR/AcrR family transcriptional regulator [Desulfobacterales bacterium]